MKLGTLMRTGLVAAGLLASTATSAFAQAGETIKVGILHSLSGTMAISETTLKDVVLMMIEEQNKKGGLLGKKLEAVVVDPASNWPLFGRRRRRRRSASRARRRRRPGPGPRSRWRSRGAR